MDMFSVLTMGKHALEKSTLDLDQPSSMLALKKLLKDAAARNAVVLISEGKPSAYTQYIEEPSRDIDILAAARAFAFAPCAPRTLTGRMTFKKGD